MPPGVPNGEAGPDFSTFGGGAGAAGGIIGTNQLQTSVDKFAQAVDKLDSAVGKIASMPLPSASKAWSAAPFQGFPQVINPFQAGPAEHLPQPGQHAAPQQPQWFAPQTVPAHQPQHAAPAAAAGAAPPPSGPVFTNTGTMGGANGGGPPPGGGGGGGPGGPPGGPPGGGPPGPPGGGGGGGGGRGGFNTTYAAGAGAAGLGAGGGLLGSAARMGLSYAPPAVAAGVFGLAAAGSAQQAPQIALNTLQFQSQLGGQNYATTSMGAMGTAGGSLIGGARQLQNQFSLNPLDAAAGYAVLQQATASVNPYGSAFGSRNVMSAMGGLNLANPAMSEVQNASAAQALYAPQTSLRMMMMGYPVTPRQAGTGNAVSPTSMFSPLLNRLGGGKFMTQQQLFSLLAPGQMGNVDLMNLTGGNQQQVQQYSNMLMMQNALMTGVNGQQKMNAAQAQQVLTNAASQNPGVFNQANATLAKYGFSQTQMQMLKSQAGTQAQNVADTSSGFTAGLRDATRTLSDFNTALHKIINNIPGGRGFLGFAQSFAANILGGGARTSATTSAPAQSQATKPVAAANSITAQAKTAVADAETQLGVPYAWGVESPGVGFDCSALVQWSYAQAGVQLPRTSQQQWAALKGSRAVNLNQVAEGDLIFLAGSDGTAAAPGHVAMMVNNHQFIEAQQTGVPIHIKPYNPKDWLYAARPTGKLGPLSGGSGTPGTSTTSQSGPAAAAGMGGVAPGTGDYSTEGSTSELSAFTSAIVGSIGGPPAGGTGKSSTSGKNKTGAGAGGGSASPGLVSVGKYLMGRGYSKPAAAGAAGVVGGEAGPSGSPESVGPGGYGLIAWTPPFSAGEYAAGAVPPQPTGNVGADMAAQLKAMYNWMNVNGWPPPQNRWPNSAAGALQAAYSASSTYERPAVAGSDVHSALVYGVYNQLAAGGSARAGSMAWVGERGPELVSFTKDATVHSADQSARLMKSAMTGSAHGPWAAGAGTGYAYSPLHPVFGNSKSGGGVTINFAAGSICINSNAGTSMSATGNSGQAMAQTFAKQLKAELGRMNLAGAIGSGVTS